jgi:hypothetical protein
VIHSSGQGVYGLYGLPLGGSRLGDQFDWERRVLP